MPMHTVVSVRMRVCFCASIGVGVCMSMPAVCGDLYISIQLQSHEPALKRLKEQVVPFVSRTVAASVC